MVDTGSPVSFIDEESATELLKQAKAKRRALTNREKKEKYPDFNGNAVECTGRPVIDMKYGEWTREPSCTYWGINSRNVYFWGPTSRHNWD